MITLGLSWPVFSQVNGVEIANRSIAQVFGGKAPVVKVIDAEGKELASIPIAENPGSFIYSEPANTIYVVHTEKKFGHFISAVNLTANRVDKQIRVGAGEAVELLESGDGHRVLCYTAVKGPTTNGMSVIYNEGMAIYAGPTLAPPFQPVVSVIDTASNEVVTTYEWLDALTAGLVGAKDRWYLANKLIAVGDGGVLVVRSEVFLHKSRVAKFVVFSGKSPQPAFKIETTGRVVAAMFSKVENLLFVAIAGDKKTDGSLVVVDLAKGTAVAHALTDHPTRLFRLGSTPQPWILGNEEMRTFSETGELGDQRIPLGKPTKAGPAGETGASAFVDGFPGATISLGNDHAAIQITNKNGGSRHKVALVDLKKGQVDAIIPTMSSGEVAGIRIGRFAASLAIAEATLGGVMMVPQFIRNESLAGRPDGRFLFALDLEGHVVTVVDVETATVVKRIPMNHTVTGLRVSADAKHLICFGTKPQQINLETNDLEN